MRVLITGMGGELGSLVASMLEAEPWVGSLVGIDVDPPRRWRSSAPAPSFAPRSRSARGYLIAYFSRR